MKIIQRRMHSSDNSPVTFVKTKNQGRKLKDKKTNICCNSLYCERIGSVFYKLV